MSWTQNLGICTIKAYSEKLKRERIIAAYAVECCVRLFSRHLACTLSVYVHK